VGRMQSMFKQLVTKPNSAKKMDENGTPSG